MILNKNNYLIYFIIYSIEYVLQHSSISISYIIPLKVIYNNKTHFNQIKVNGKWFSVHQKSLEVLQGFFASIKIKGKKQKAKGKRQKYKGY